ncbi:hypothetical protein Ahia01_000939000 [Argonauta hians]
MDQKVDDSKKETNMAIPWKYTATGEIGHRRDPMLLNELLLRPALGRRRFRSYTMPTHWTYGVKEDSESGTVIQALRGWDMPTVLHPVKPTTKSMRNYIALNNDCVKNGIATAPEQYAYRKLHDIRKVITKERAPKSSKMDLPSNKTYGLPIRPNTPMQDLISNKFGAVWLKEKKDKLIRKMERDKIMQSQHHAVYKTKTTMLTAFQQPIKEAPLWKLPRFTKSAKPHLETFRSETCKEAALKKFQYDKASRVGAFQQGIYNAAYH